MPLVEIKYFNALIDNKPYGTFPMKMKQWNLANDESNSNYDVGTRTIYGAEVLKYNLCDCNDA